MSAVAQIDTISNDRNSTTRGWANAGWHRPGDKEVVTPNLDAMVKNGIELNRSYAYKCCSPTRSSLQSGRLPVHVNTENDSPDYHNPDDPVSGFAGIPRNMTGIATKLREAGYLTHQIGSEWLLLICYVQLALLTWHALVLHAEWVSGLPANPR